MLPFRNDALMLILLISFFFALLLPRHWGKIHKNLTKTKRCILHQKLRVRAILTMRGKTGCPTNQ